MKRSLKQHKIAFAILLFIIIVLFYPFTIFFRGSIVPLYVNTFYRGSVTDAYHKTFDSLNIQFITLGFKISEQAATCYNGVSDNGNAWFHYASETVPCLKTSNSQGLRPTAAFKKQWEALAPTIHAGLLANNWTDRTYNFGPNPKLADLYKVLDQAHYYTKAFGKYKCDLTFEHANYSGQPSDENNNKASVRESCTRNVSFFGGYID
jgi:hypothetical protein